jgi:hypothetical protein
MDVRIAIISSDSLIRSVKSMIYNFEFLVFNLKFRIGNSEFTNAYGIIMPGYIQLGSGR